MKKISIIRSRAPLRIGLAGGGTDLSPYCDLYGGYVLNATIERYAYSVIKTHSDPVVRFVATDQQIEKVLPIETPFKLDGKLDLHVAVYSYFINNFNNGIPIPLELFTYSDVPVGSGLGSSSTLVVAMIKAFAELLNSPLDKHAIAHIAYQIERVDCRLQGGRQDQYSATFGGLNFMEFYEKERVVINPLKINNQITCELESCSLLYFTGISRESANIITDQIKSVKTDDSEALIAMHEIKKEALVMKECLLKGDFLNLIKSLRLGWENKKRSAKTVSNSYIDNIYNAAIKAGASAGKVSGAGGGGFMYFLVPVEKRMNVIKTLNTFGGSISNCHFTKQGAQAWKIG